jgi:hypothetical protein
MNIFYILFYIARTMLEKVAPHVPLLSFDTLDRLWFWLNAHSGEKSNPTDGEW